MTAGAHSAHRSPRRGQDREARRRSLLREAEQASFQALFSTFAAQVAEQRYDTDRAVAYRAQAARCRITSARLRLAAERCRPWWTRPRAAVREWLQELGRLVTLDWPRGWRRR